VALANSAAPLAESLVELDLVVEIEELAVLMAEVVVN